MRDSMIIYRSFFEAIKELKKEQQAEVWNAVFELGLNKQIVELTGISKTIFTLIAPQIQANLKRFENGKKPKQKRSETEAKEEQNESETEANNNNNENNNINENENVNNNTNDIEFIYNLYPSKCPYSNRATSKGSKDKDKIKTIIKRIGFDKLKNTIDFYLTECSKTKTYLKNFSVFLNNLPEIVETQIEQPKQKEQIYCWDVCFTRTRGTKERYEQEVKQYGSEVKLISITDGN